MNIYKYHKNRSLLDRYEDAIEVVPDLIILKYGEENYVEIMKREQSFSKDARWAYWYTINYFDSKRWLEAEDVIKKDPKWAYHYAEEVYLERWPEAEEYIQKDEFWWNEYKWYYGIDNV